MKKPILLRILSSMGSLAAIAAPVAAVVSCGVTQKAKPAAAVKPNPIAGTNTNGGSETGTPANPGSGPSTNTNNGQIETTETPGATETPGTTETPGATETPGTVKGATGQTVTGPVKTYNGKPIVSSAAKVITKTFGDGNLANPTRTYAMDAKNQMEQKTRMVTGQPYALHYHMDDVAQWTAGKDADDAFNVATVPLHDRTLAGKILASSKDKQLQILGCLSKGTAQTELGTSDKDNVNDAVFQMWSQVTSFVGWGGSASEGNFVIPKGDDINAAHKNGVPLLGTLFFPPAAFGGGSDLYDKITKKVGNTFPVADKMVEMAQHFGFDGWFLNLEAPNTGPGDMKGFLKYFHDKMVAKKLFTVLYDFGAGWRYMMGTAEMPFDKAAIDFSDWSKTYVKDEEMREYGFDYDKYATNTKHGDFADKNLWLYTYFKRHDITDGDQVDLETFSDKDGSRDPRAHATDSSYGGWTGLSKLFQAHSPITSREEFSSSFETGIGSNFFINGEQQKLGSNLVDHGYRNQGLQDVLPTYRYISDEYSSETQLDDSTRVSTPGTKIDDDGKTWKGDIDETGIQYYGSSSLHYTGKVSTGNTMVNRLYGSNVALKTGDQFSTVVSGTNIKTNLALWLQDKVDTDAIQEHANGIIVADKSEDLGNGFKKLTYKVPKSMDGKTMVSFGLAFSNVSPVNLDIDTRVGQLSFSPIGTAQKPANWITSVTADGSFKLTDEGYLRVNWQVKDKAAIDHYVIWSTEGKTKDNFDKKDILSMTSLPAAYLKDIDIKPNVNLVIDAVDAEDNVVSSNKVTVQTTLKTPTTSPTASTAQAQVAKNPTLKSLQAKLDAEQARVNAIVSDASTVTVEPADLPSIAPDSILDATAATKLGLATFKPTAGFEYSYTATKTGIKVRAVLNYDYTLTSVQKEIPVIYADLKQRAINELQELIDDTATHMVTMAKLTGADVIDELVASSGMTETLGIPQGLMNMLFHHITADYNLYITTDKAHKTFKFIVKLKADETQIATGSSAAKDIPLEV